MSAAASNRDDPARIGAAAAGSLRATGFQVCATESATALEGIRITPSKAELDRSPSVAEEPRWGARPEDWRHLASQGIVSDLLPVVSNPNAVISARSKMRDLGKVPSRFNSEREAVGIPSWTQAQTTKREVERWLLDGDLGICVQTRSWRAIDIDIADPARSAEVRELIEITCGRMHLRQRPNSGKCLLVFQCDAPMHKRIIRTSDGLIELLATGQQFVAVGTHPSGARYEWPQGLPGSAPLGLVTELTLREVDDLWAGLMSVFGLERIDVKAGARPSIPRNANQMYSDQVVGFLLENKWVRSIDRDGRVHVNCPWADSHTSDTSETASTYFPVGVGGFAGGGYKCLHAHCADKHVGNFLSATGFEASLFDDVRPNQEDSAEQEAICERDAKLEVGDKVDFTDVGNVNLLAKLTHGDLRYVHEFKLWLTWTGEQWKQDPTHTVANANARRVGDYYAAQAARLKMQIETADPSLVKGLQKQLVAVQAHEKACRSRRGIENMLALASRDGRFVIMAERLDRDPHLLGVQNGVVDLRTGELRPDSRDEFVTMRCNVAFHADAPAPRFCQLVDEVTGFPIEPDRHADGSVVASTVGRYTLRPELARYLQKSLGYSISAVTREQKMFTTYGADGSNGKNQLMEAVLNTVGPYGVRARPALLMTNRRSEQDANNATPALKALEHKRLVVLSEPDANCIIDNGILKAITGDKEMSGRAMYGAETNIVVTFHLWMLANVKPPLDHMEPAVVGRIAMLPFDRTWNRPGTVQRNPAIPDGDPQLAETLQREREGILRWLVEGAAAYFREGLAPCAEVQSTTVGYLNDQDPVARWLELYDRCPPQEGTSASDLYRQFSDWLEAEVLSDSGGSGHAPNNLTAFGLALKAKGIARKTIQTVKYGLRKKLGEGRP